MNESQKYKTLYYFTESYPYGLSEQWKRNELEVFRDYFQRIVVVPKGFGGNSRPRNLVDGVEYHAPILAEQASRTLFEKIRIQFSCASISDVISEIRSSRAHLSPQRAKELRGFLYGAGILLTTAAYKEILAKRNDPTSVFYYFWGSGSVDALPFLHGFHALKVCRFHRWDLYTETRPTGYIPFRSQLLDALDLVLPCSEHGAAYLRSRFPSARGKVHTARLGTLSRGQSPLVADDVLKLVTCSSVTHVKRLDRIASALAKVNFPVSWTHIGDGPMMADIKERTSALPNFVSVHLLGGMASEVVLDHMVSHPFDLFINVSDSEGVPVSIMEAFSAGIPVYATDVGGSSEIVDGTVGKLLPSACSPEDIALELAAFRELPQADKAQMRLAAFARYEERCNAHTNARHLAELITSVRPMGSR